MIGFASYNHLNNFNTGKILLQKVMCAHLFWKGFLKNRPESHTELPMMSILSEVMRMLFHVVERLTEFSKIHSAVEMLVYCCIEHLS